MRKTLLAAPLLLLAVAACGGSGATSAPATPAPASAGPASASPSTAASAAPTDAAPSASAATDSTVVIVRDFTLDPIDVTEQGEVSLAVTNEGPTVHNIAIRDGSEAVVGTTANLLTGESETLTVDIPAGTYTLFCSLPGHESLGIKGTLTVTE